MAGTKRTLALGLPTVRRVVGRIRSTIAESRACLVAKHGRLAERLVATTSSILLVVGASTWPPTAQAQDGVTYEVFSEVVPRLSGVEYRDVEGKHLLQDVSLPWQITVPVADPTSPTDDGAELRADWRPNFRTAQTVGAVLRGKFVTVRISLRGKVLCESRLDVGNATCFGNVPHRS